jgi:acetyl esterase/lipase
MKTSLVSRARAGIFARTRRVNAFFSAIGALWMAGALAAIIPAQAESNPDPDVFNRLIGIPPPAAANRSFNLASAKSSVATAAENLLEMMDNSTPTDDPPVITVQPIDRTETEGEKARFIVTASGTEPLRYQWRKNGVDIAGANSPSYTSQRVTRADDGSIFSVVVSNRAGSVTSVDVTLTIPPNEIYGYAPDGAPLHWDVYTPRGAGPWPVVLLIHGGGYISGSPTSNQQSVGCAHDLAAAGYLALSITYRLAPPGRIEGQTSTGCAPQQYDDIKMAARAARADPRCNGRLGVIGGSAGGGHAAWLAVDHLATHRPRWSGEDRPDGAICLSGPYNFTDYRPNNNLDGFVSNVTSYCCVPDTTEPTEEDRAILEANSPVTRVDIRARPMLLVNSERDFMPIEQQEDMVAALDAAFGGEPNYEAITVSGNDHSWPIWTNIISGTETVRDRGLAFFAAIFGLSAITTQPASQTVTVGQRATFSVTAAGTAPLSYQWRKGGATIPGATQDSYTTSPTAPDYDGTLISVVVSNRFGSVTSMDATLTVTPATPPSITTQSADKTVAAGETAKFSVRAIGRRH